MAGLSKGFLNPAGKHAQNAASSTSCIKCFGANPQQKTCSGCETFVCTFCHWCKSAEHEIRECAGCETVSCRDCGGVDGCEGCGRITCWHCGVLETCNGCDKVMCIQGDPDKSCLSPNAYCAVACVDCGQDAYCRDCQQPCYLCQQHVCEGCVVACSGCNVRLCEVDYQCFGAPCDSTPGCDMWMCLLCVAANQNCSSCNQPPTHDLRKVAKRKLKVIKTLADEAVAATAEQFPEAAGLPQQRSFTAHAVREHTPVSAKTGAVAAASGTDSAPVSTAAAGAKEALGSTPTAAIVAPSKPEPVLEPPAKTPEELEEAAKAERAAALKEERSKRTAAKRERKKKEKEEERAAKAQLAAAAAAEAERAAAALRAQQEREAAEAAAAAALRERLAAEAAAKQRAEQEAAAAAAERRAQLHNAASVFVGDFLTGYRQATAEDVKGVFTAELVDPEFVQAAIGSSFNLLDAVAAVASRARVSVQHAMDSQALKRGLRPPFPFPVVEPAAATAAAGGDAGADWTDTAADRARIAACTDEAELEAMLASARQRPGLLSLRKAIKKQQKRLKEAAAEAEEAERKRSSGDKRQLPMRVLDLDPRISGWFIGKDGQRTKSISAEMRRLPGGHHSRNVLLWIDNDWADGTPMPLDAPRRLCLAGTAQQVAKGEELVLAAIAESPQRDTCPPRPRTGKQDRAEEPARKAAAEARAAGHTHLSIECPRTHTHLNWGTQLLPALQKQLQGVALRAFGGVSSGVSSGAAAAAPLFITATGSPASSVHAAEKCLQQLFASNPQIVSGQVASLGGAFGTSSAATVIAAAAAASQPSYAQRLSSSVTAATAAAAAAGSVTALAASPDGRALEAYLVRLDLGKYLPNFLSAGCYLGALQSLSDADMEGMGIPKGPRLKLMKARKADAAAGAGGAGGSAAAAAPKPQRTHDQDDADGKCRICWERMPAVMVLPCSHHRFCAECIYWPGTTTCRYTDCPFCTIEIKSVIKHPAEEDDTGGLCEICWDRPREVVLLACGHARCCKACMLKPGTTDQAVDHIKECPSCRTPITGVLIMQND